jgi:hypothetical protein
MHTKNRARPYCTTGNRYLGGFIGEEDAKNKWVDEMVEGWVQDIRIFAQTSLEFPQTAYAGFKHSKQMEWQFVQRVLKGLSAWFAPLDEAIENDFITHLFEDSFENDPHRMALFHLPVKLAGLAIPKPTVTGEMNYKAS